SGYQIDRVVKNYTAKAIWKPAGAQQYTITYRLGNYLTGDERIVTDYCYAGNKYTFLTYDQAGPIISDGNEFAGWTMDGTDYAPKAKVTIDGNKTVTAREKSKTSATGIALCREAERGVVESKIMTEESNQANAPLVGVTKGSTINYTVKMFTGGTIEDFWYVLTSNEHNDIAKASIKDDVLTITGLKAGETNIAIEASSKNGDTNRQQWFRIVVSEIAEQDTSAAAVAASGAAATALAETAGVNLEIDDYNLTCRTGIVASETNTAANIDGRLADAVMSNLVGMDDTLSEAEQTALKNGYDTYLYVEAAAQNENQVDQAVKEAMETHMPAGSTVGAYMDIDFYAQIGNSARRAVTDTGTDEGVEISVDTDDFEPLEAGATRSVTVLRYHDGAAEKVDDVTVNGTTATFKTSKFSPYVILFSDFRTTQQPGDVASVTPHYKVLNETTSEWEEHTFTTSYYSDIKEAFTAASDQTYKSEISGLPENQDYFQYYPATIKLLDDAAIENGETCTAAANIDIDLNGHTFEIKEGGTLTGGSYANVTIDSETVGTFRSAGTISTEYFSAWTADTYYITGGNITSFFGIDGGNVNISGGTFSEDLMANNGSEADINVNISGTAEFTQFVECMPYGSSSDEPTLRMTISENARIKGLIFGIIEGTAEITTPNLIINGGYFGTDPSTLKSNYPNN
ncbi:MAG: hypothetical protein IJG06_01685, partial [Clostridia bacterium]|nr:hypothetical protein [Clostridia bacterium]